MSIVVICVAILVVIYIMLSGIVVNGWCHATVSLEPPARFGESVWMVEIENVNANEDCSGLEHFGVHIEQEDKVIVHEHHLLNGLTAQAGGILVFFADQSKVGRVGAGDQFYLVNLEVGSEYKFHVLDGWGPAGNVTVYT